MPITLRRPHAAGTGRKAITPEPRTKTMADGAGGA